MYTCILIHTHKYKHMAEGSQTSLSFEIHILTGILTDFNRKNVDKINVSVRTRSILLSIGDLPNKLKNQLTFRWHVSFGEGGQKNSFFSYTN